MKKIYLFIILLLNGVTLVAQEEYNMTGLLPDDGTYNTLPQKVNMVTREYTMLPTYYSLQQFCPVAKSQTQYGTCAAWSTVYAARTIAEAIKCNWTDFAKITEEAFSPLFVFQMANETYNYNRINCQRGIHLHNALNILKDVGAPKFASLEADLDSLCIDYVSDELLVEASNYKIKDYCTLFPYKEPNSDLKIRKVKKAISEKRPVIIAMHLPPSFSRFWYQAKGSGLWSVNNSTDYVDESKHGYHAMCVVGYDDAFNGGAFYIMNSWGQSWGHNGFVWVSYEDFGKYVDQAFEMELKPNDLQFNTELKELSGEIELELSTGEQMKPILDQAKMTYKIDGDFISGTRYRIFISNNEPAYVYVIGSDLVNNVSKIFPPQDNISAALTYKSNKIAIPDETYYVEMDNTTGTDYMCVLYSKESLDINQIIGQIKSASGSFQEKVYSVIGDKIAPNNDINLAQGKIGFNAVTGNIVVPVFIEISHK